MGHTQSQLVDPKSTEISIEGITNCTQKKDPMQSEAIQDPMAQEGDLSLEEDATQQEDGQQEEELEHEDEGLNRHGLHKKPGKITQVRDPQDLSNLQSYPDALLDPAQDLVDRQTIARLNQLFDEVNSERITEVENCYELLLQDAEQLRETLRIQGENISEDEAIERVRTGTTLHSGVKNDEGIPTYNGDLKKTGGVRGRNGGNGINLYSYNESKASSAIFAMQSRNGASILSLGNVPIKHFAVLMDVSGQELGIPQLGMKLHRPNSSYVPLYVGKKWIPQWDVKKLNGISKGSKGQNVTSKSLGDMILRGGKHNKKDGRGRIIGYTQIDAYWKQTKHGMFEFPGNPEESEAKFLKQRARNLKALKENQTYMDKRKDFINTYSPFLP
jgi:hypothetical protein